MKWGHLALALIIIQTLSACAGTNLSAMKQNLDAKQRKIIQDLTPLKIPVAKLGRVVILNKTGVAKYVASIQPSKIWWEFGPITNCNLISLYTWQADCLDEVSSELYKSWRAVAEGIQRSNIFDKMVIEEVDSEKPVTVQPSEAVIYLVGFESLNNRWFYLSETTGSTTVDCGRCIFWSNSTPLRLLVEKVAALVEEDTPVRIRERKATAEKLALDQQIANKKRHEELRIAQEQQRVREQLAQIERERLTLVEKERIARDGDGTEDDLACQKRKLKLSSQQYLVCREVAGKKRDKDEASRLAAEEKKRLADEAREAKRVAAEQAIEEKKKREDAARVASIPKPIQNDFTGGGRLSLDSAKSKCGELGFKPSTEGFGKCVLQLSK